jgi:hypothetical protein
MSRQLEILNGAGSANGNVQGFGGCHEPPPAQCGRYKFLSTLQMFLIVTPESKVP